MAEVRAMAEDSGWNIWNVLTITCLTIVAAIEAVEQAMSGAPHVAARLPHLDGFFHYLPLLLLIVAGISWFVGRRSDKPVNKYLSPSSTSSFRNPRWQIVNHHQFENQSIDVDSRSFRGCTFKNVRFSFHGTGPTEFTGNSKFEGNIILSTDHPPTMFWRTLEHIFTTIPGAEVETSPVDKSGHKVERKVDATSVDPAKPLFSLDAFDGEIHSYTVADSYFSIRNCGQRTARNIRFDRILSKSGYRGIQLDAIPNLASGERLPLRFRAGADDDWTFEGVVNHLILFCEDNPSKEKVFYPVTIRFLDGDAETSERHILECEQLLQSGVKLRIYPAAGSTSPASSY